MARSQLLLLLALVPLACRAAAAPERLRIGVMTDCQYADQDDAGVRHYRESPRKLAEALAHFDQLDPEWLLHLGDFIDERYESFGPLLELCGRSELRVHHVLGNHDFNVEDRYKRQVPELLGMPAPYYSWRTKGWRFVALDGNDLSLHAYPEGSARQRESVACYEGLQPRPAAYNGAIGPQQLEWLEDQLSEAEEQGEAVLLLCHFPVHPAAAHNLWNAEEVLAVIDRHPCVQAWLSGHNHAGDQALRNGVQHLTFQGMVDTDVNAYALVELTADRLRVQGFGREPDRELVLRGAASAPEGAAQAAREERARSSQGAGW